VGQPSIVAPGPEQRRQFVLELAGAGWRHRPREQAVEPQLRPDPAQVQREALVSGTAKIHKRPPDLSKAECLGDSLVGVELDRAQADAAARQYRQQVAVQRSAGGLGESSTQTDVCEEPEAGVSSG